jgi:hypothetical protein
VVISQRWQRSTLQSLHHEVWMHWLSLTTPREPPYVIDLNAGGDQVKNLQREVSGVFDVVGHRECDLVINDESRTNGSPVNVRVSHWVLNDSLMAREGRAWEGAVIYGDVVIAGPPRGGESTDVHPALVHYFDSLELSPKAMADWDVRNTDWPVTSWDLDRDRGDDGYGLGL